MKTMVTVAIPTWDVDYVGGERDVITLNGMPPSGVANGFLQGQDETWSNNYFTFDVTALHFPEVPEDESQAPTPALNTIEIDVDVTRGGWCTELDWVMLNYTVASPVVMAHGLAADRSWFEIDLKGYVGTTLGLPTRLCDFGDSSGFANGSIEHNAVILADDVAALKHHTGSEDVVIIGHSMGGIVARHYAERSNGDDTDVERVIQIGSPNVGSVVADLGIFVQALVNKDPTGSLKDRFPDLGRFNGPGLHQMTTTYMGLYNAAHGRSPKTTFSSIAGASDTPPNCPPSWMVEGTRVLEIYVHGQTLVSNDSVVSKNSAWGTTDASNLLAYGFEGDERAVVADSTCQQLAAHDRLVQGWWTNTPHVPWLPPITRDQILLWLQDYATFPKAEASTGSQRRLAPSDMSLQAGRGVTSSRWQATAGSAAEIAVGSQWSCSIPVSRTGPATIMIPYGGGDVDVELRDPSGTIVLPTSMGVQYFKGPLPLVGQPVVCYYLENAESGLWSITVHVLSSTAADGKVGIVAFAEVGAASVALDAVVAPSVVRSGSPVLFEAHLRSGDVPLLGATAVQARVSDVAPGSASSAAVTLLDDGTSGDEVAFDATYTGVIPNAVFAGEHRLVWQVEGYLPDATPFSVGAAGSYTVAGSVGSIDVAGLSDFGTDSNANGLYDSLSLLVPVSVEATGRYVLFGRIVDSAGYAHSARSDVTLSSGSSMITLAFEGSVFFEKGIDGPYTVTELALESIDSSGESTQLALLPGLSRSTQSYGHEEFEHDTNIRETGVFVARGLDTNGTGKFDLLETDIGLAVSVPGAYIVSAILTDTSGAFVQSLTTAQNFVAGDQTVRLQFSGRDIYFHPVNGPLVVRGLCMYGGDVPSYFSTAFYQTQPFAASEFDCPLSRPEYVRGRAEVTLAVPSGQNSAVVEYEEPVFRYCGPFTLSCYPLSGSEFPLGTTLVTCSVNAEDGTSASWPIFVKVVEQCVSFAIDDPATTLLPAATVGEAYGGVEITTTGGGYPVVVTATGLPPGMSFADGRPTGTPTQAGGYILAVTATDSYGCTTTRDYALNVSCEGIELSPGELPEAAVGAPYSVAFSATGGVAPYTYIVRTYQDTLPAGVTFVNGTLSGTPTQGGNFKFAVQATDASGCLTVHDYTLSVDCAELVIGPEILPTATVGVPYPPITFSSTGTPPFAYQSAFLPIGMNVVDGRLVGTPTYFGSGTYNPVVYVTDAKGCSGTRTYSLTLNRPPTARCQNVTVPYGPGCVANASVDNGSSDPDGNPVTVSQSPNGPYPLGVTSVILTVTDSHGASSQCAATVTVVDSVAPVFPVAPSGVDVRATPGSTSATVAFATPTATDACGGAAVSCVPGSGSVFALGTTTVTCTAIDGSGNQATTSFAVYVRNSGDSLGSGSSFGQWSEASSNGNGAQVATFAYAPPSPTGTYLDSVSGDWNADGVDSVGAVYSSTGAGGTTLAHVYLRNSNSAGSVNTQFTVTLPANTGAPYVPLAGDWDGDGSSTLAFYRPSSGVFYLRNTNTSGAPDFSFAFGAANSIPLRGDWDGNGVDSVGVYVTSTSTFSARNSNSAGAADVTLLFGSTTSTAAPVSGDWDGDSIDTLGFIGTMSGSPGNIHLHNANAVAPPVLNFYLSLGSGRMVSGNWDGNHLPYVRSVSPQTCIAGQSNVLFTFTGSDLGAVSSVAFLPSDAITVGSVTGGPGTVTASVSVAPGASIGLRSVRLVSSGGDSNSVPIVVRAPGGIGETDTVGLVDVPNGSWLLRNSNSPGPASTTYYFSPYGPSLTPLRGDWNGDGIDTPGWFDPGTNSFYLRNSNSAGPPDLSITFNVTTLSRLPVTGDWNGDGTDTVGLFETATGKFYLRNTNSPSSTQTSFVFRPVIGSVVPVIGDWDGSGTDTIGIYYATSGTFYLRNANSAGAANVQAQYGPSGTAFRPIVGDWNGDLSVTLGLYDPSTGAFFLKNSNSGGAADLVFTYGAASANYVPLVGDWDALGLP